MDSPVRGLPQEDQLQLRIISASDNIKPSVVHISAIVRVNDRRNRTVGSGLVASKDGKILTSHHVVERALKIEVTVPGWSQPFPAEILGADKQTDVALLQIDTPDPLPVPSFSKNANVRVGQWVLAVGNPYGLEGTVSFGIVSAKGRNLEAPDLINDFIQTDAMIDRGSSGGPLVDLEGRVIGLNSRGKGRGIGFTVPIDTVLSVMQQIRNGGISRGWLGISMQPLSRDLASYFEVPNATGVILNSVSPGSPASHGNLKIGDIITHFNQTAIKAEKEEDLRDFQRMVANSSPGKSVLVTFLREGRSQKATIVLAVQPKIEASELETGLGFLVQEITEQIYRERRLESRQGAYVSFVARGSLAAEAGLRLGDVIKKIEGVSVSDLEKFNFAVSQVDDMSRFLITARRGNDIKYLLLNRGSELTAAHKYERDGRTVQIERAQASDPMAH